MVEQLGEGYHGCVLKVFPEASGHQVNVDPPNIGFIEYLWRKELWVILGDSYKLFRLLHVLIKLLFGHLSDNRVFQHGKLLLTPESQIINLPGKIVNQVEPLRFLSLPKLVQDEGQQDVIFPVIMKLFVVILGILLKKSLYIAEKSHSCVQ